MEATNGSLVMARRNLKNLKKQPKKWNLTQWKVYMDKAAYENYKASLLKIEPVPAPAPTPGPVTDLPLVEEIPVKDTPVTPVPETTVPDIPEQPKPLPIPEPVVESEPVVPLGYIVVDGGNSVKIEAEKYTQSLGINTQTTTDEGSGLNVGRLEAGNWVKYNIFANVAGDYNFNFRLAANQAAQFEVRDTTGNLLKTVEVPLTGSWQNWITKSETIPLSKGAQTLQIISKKKDWNFNWFEIGGQAITETPEPGKPSDSPVINIPPILIPIEETPAAPQAEVPISEVQPKPTPPVVDTTPTTIPETGERVTDNIYPFLIKFQNDVSDQNFAGWNDGVLYTGAFSSGYNNKPRPPFTESYFIADERLNAKFKKFVLADPYGSSDAPVRFDGILKDGKGTRVPDIIPPFYGKEGQVTREFNVDPKYANGELEGFIVITPVQANRSWANIIGELTPIAEFTKFVEPEVPQHSPEWQHMNGVVGYAYNFDGKNGVMRADKAAVLEAFDGIRMYVGMPDSLHNGKFTIDPIKNGWWDIDNQAKILTEQGKWLVLCLRDGAGDPLFLQFLYNISVRYGKNKNVDPKTLNIYTDKIANTPTNEIKIGLGYNVIIQIENEKDGNWRPDFMSPFEMADFLVSGYKIIKDVNPDMPVFSNGFAKTNTGFLEGMLYRARIKHKNARMFDVYCYHDYIKSDGTEQRLSKGMAIPVDMGKYYDHGKEVQKTLFRAYPINTPLTAITESGESISSVNPEQAVIPLGNRTRFEVQADCDERRMLESMRTGHAWCFNYQAYDDSAFIRNGNGNWDQSNGIADRNDGKDTHKRRPATDRRFQMRKYLHGYKMTVKADRTQEVWVDKLQKAGKPDFYTVLTPTYEDKKVDYTLNLPGVTNATIIRPQSGADNTKEEAVTIKGSLKLVATESVTYVRVDK